MGPENPPRGWAIWTEHFAGGPLLDDKNTLAFREELGNLTAVLNDLYTDVWFPPEAETNRVG